MTSVVDNYEIFGEDRGIVKPFEVRIAKTELFLNCELARAFRAASISNVVVLCDRAAGKLALRRVNDLERGRKVTYQQYDAGQIYIGRDHGFTEGKFKVGPLDLNGPYLLQVRYASKSLDVKQ